MRVAVRIDQAKTPLKVTPEDLASVRKAVRRCLRREVISAAPGMTARLLSPDDSVEIGVSFVADEHIRVLNREYRGIDSGTDVLSFWSDLDTDEIHILRESGDALPLGDVIVSTERAMHQASEYGHSFRRELVYLVVHGVLHLLGYDHHEAAERSAMRQAEESILSSLGIERTPEE
jgi:probable rRNA maturation factor